MKKIKKVKKFLTGAYDFFYRHFEWVVITAVVIFSWWLMSSTFIYRGGQFFIAPKLYSDFGAHLPLIRSFSLGQNWPPEYPFFAGQPIRYHYLFYLVVGMGERIGLNVALVLNVLSTLGLVLLLVMVYKLTYLFFKSKLAGLLSIIFVLFNGSLSFVEYFEQNGWSWVSLWDIPSKIQFASFGPWSGRAVAAFWNLNIYTNQRHLALSYGLLLLLIYPLVKSLYKKFSLHPIFHFLIIAGYSLFPLLHQAGYLMLFVVTIIWLLFYARRTSRLLITYSMALFCSFMVFWFGTTGSGQLPLLQPFYLATDRTVLGLLNYWWRNLGGYLLLVIPALAWSIKKRNLLWPIFIFIFIAANTWRLSADMINNHKLINLSVIVLQIISAGLLIKISKYWLLKPLVILTIIFLTFSGVMDFFPILNDSGGPVNDYPRSPVIAWIKDNTPRKTQFLTSSYFYNPASLAGRQIFLDYGYHAWSMGYDDHYKRAALNQLYSPTITLREWCGLMHQFDLSYVLLGPGEDKVEDNRIDVRTSMIAQMSPTVTLPDNWRVYDVKKICQE